MSLVSNNCYGVAYEKSKGGEYTTPFFSVFIVAEDYVCLLENFDEYIKLDPIASENNKTRHYKTPRKYPVLLLKDVEIHFAHEKNGAEAAIEKWCRRRDRMDLDKNKMIVKFCDRDKFSIKIAERFLALEQFPNKTLYISERWVDLVGAPNVVLTEYKTRCPIGTKLEKEYPVILDEIFSCKNL